MKNQVKFLCIAVILLSSVSLFSQNLNNRSNYDAFDANGNPIQRTKEIAIVFVDFADGRWYDNGESKQPLNYQQLENVQCLDAVAEIGLESTPGLNYFPYKVTHDNTDLYFHPAKYTWQDRYKMYFSTDGSYNFNAHPDYSTHYPFPEFRTQAYGSMAEYWKEVSDDKFSIVAAVTHPGYPLERQGIVNNWIDNGNKEIIKYITLPRNKYGTNTNSYFTSWDSPVSSWNTSLLCTDTQYELRRKYNLGQGEIKFNIDAFNGTLIIVIAGSHKSYKGTGSGGIIIIRGMFCDPNINATTPYTYHYQLDGITCITHEFAELALGWKHSVSGRNDLLNTHQTKDINCPSHPNPICKLKEGWVTPIHLENNQNNIDLPPVETSKQVGIITIYGKPSAAPDHLLGECYVVENRKRIGFDRMLEGDDPNLSNFKGGLLIWHYSPSTPFDLPYAQSDYNSKIKFIPAHGVFSSELNGTSNYPPTIMGNGFFAYSQNATSQHTTFLTPRTYSAQNKKTGIELTNIHQTDYTIVNSHVIFDLSYTISQPTQYDYIIYNNPNLPSSNELISTSGKIYFLEESSSIRHFLKLLPGARVETASDATFSIAGIEASGSVEYDEQSFVTFGSVGYKNNYESHYCKFNGWNINQGHFKSYQDVDSAIFRNTRFENLNNEKTKIRIFNDVATPLPCVIENITTDNPNTTEYDIELTKALISKLDYSGFKTMFRLSTTIGDITINNSKVDFHPGNCYFDANSNIIFNYCYLTGGPISSLLPSNNNDWKGIKLIGGGINFDQVTINKARTGLDLKNLNQGYTINGCNFSNIYGNILIDNCNNDIAPSNINNCNFNTAPSFGAMNDYFVYITNTNYTQLTNNRFNNIRNSGLVLSGCVDPVISDNVFDGTQIGSDMGIVSSSSNGTYNCNDISGCYYGAFFNNSQPILYHNEIYSNGVGMYLTNNSQVIMNPAYIDDQTVILAGYNNIHDNSGYEIFIDNNINATNGLFMEDGYNTIENDESEEYLIYISNKNNDPEMILCTGNYWGTIINPQYKLYPIECFAYDPYLLDPPSPPSACLVETNNEDNSNQSEQMLLMGNIMNSKLNKNFTSAVSYSEQLANLSGNKSFKKLGLRSVFINKYLSGQNIPSLIAYYNNMIPQYYNDSIILRHIRNLKIESKIINSQYISALENLDEIISNYNNPYELLYANIDKLRILSLLDSNLEAGDNSYSLNSNLNQKTIDLIKKDVFVDKNHNFTDKSESNVRKKENSNSVNKILNDLYIRIQKDITNYEKSGELNKSKLIAEKTIYDLISNNYIPDLPKANKRQKELFRNKSNNSIPKIYSLFQNYPNPFNPVTKINYDLPKDSWVKLVIFDVLGREVKTLVNDLKTSGSYTVEFNGSGLASGIYFYRIQAGDFVKVKRMVLVK